MGPCWDPKSVKNWKKEVPEGVQKAFNFQDHFCPLLVLSWEPTWLQVGPRTGQDSAQERPRAAQDGPRDSPETLRKRKAHPRRLVPRKMTRGTLQNDPISMDFKVHLYGFQTHV